MCVVYCLDRSGGVVVGADARSMVVCAFRPWLNPGSPESHYIGCILKQTVHPCEFGVMQYVAQGHLHEEKQKQVKAVKCNES